MKSNRILIALLVLTMGICFNVEAQDPHLSQWQVNPTLMNPAQIGYMDNSSIRISANYRSQWASLGNNISTMALSYDRKLDGSPWSYGGYILNHNLADVFNNTSLVGGASYEITEPSNDKYHITTGVQLGMIYKRFDISRLVFDNQYNDGNFDPDLPSMENLRNKGRVMPETTIGGFYHNSNPENDIQPFGGFGVMHLTQPKENFLDGEYGKLPVRWNFSAGAKWHQDENLIVSPYAMYMMQGTATERVAGVSVDYEFEDTEYRALLDIAYRVEDAVVIQAGFYLRDNWYRISYDIHTSPLKNYTSGRNAIEFSATFIPKNGFFGKKTAEVPAR